MIPQTSLDRSTQAFFPLVKNNFDIYLWYFYGYMVQPWIPSFFGYDNTESMIGLYSGPSCNKKVTEDNKGTTPIQPEFSQSVSDPSASYNNHRYTTIRYIPQFKSTKLVRHRPSEKASLVINVMLLCVRLGILSLSRLSIRFKNFVYLRNPGRGK